MGGQRRSQSLLLLNEFSELSPTRLNALRVEPFRKMDDKARYQGRVRIPDGPLAAQRPLKYVQSVDSLLNINFRALQKRCATWSLSE